MGEVDRASWRQWGEVSHLCVAHLVHTGTHLRPLFLLLSVLAAVHTVAAGDSIGPADLDLSQPPLQWPREAPHPLPLVTRGLSLLVSWSWGHAGILDLLVTLLRSWGPSNAQSAASNQTPSPTNVMFPAPQSHPLPHTG